MLQIASLAAYYGFAALLPRVTGTEAFIGVVVTARLLLFCPIFLPMVVPSSFGSKVLKVRDAYRACYGSTVCIGGGWMMLTIIETTVALMEEGIESLKFPASINDSRAVKALAYVFVGLGSTWIWIDMIRSDLARDTSQSLESCSFSLKAAPSTKWFGGLLSTSFTSLRQYLALPRWVVVISRLLGLCGVF